MDCLKLPSSEQEVIDNLDVELKRVDINDEKDIETLKNFQIRPCEMKWFWDIFALLSKFRRSNSYLVYDGHIIGINFTQLLDGPSLKKLPENLGNLKELLYLAIFHTKIKKIPSSIAELKKLLSLKVYYNSDLVSLPESLGNLSSLIKLFLVDNNLTSLPESIGNLSQLEEIHLNNNLLTLFPESFKRLELYKIDISKNPLRSLSNINFKKIESYKIAIKNLTEKAQIILYPWTEMERLIDENATNDIQGNVNWHDDERTIRDFEPLTIYYKKSPFQLAKKYCNDPTSLTSTEKERLIWEANSSVREIIEAVYPNDNEIIIKINERLSIQLKNDYKIIF